VQSSNNLPDIRKSVLAFGWNNSGVVNSMKHSVNKIEDISSYGLPHEYILSTSCTLRAIWTWCCINVWATKWHYHNRRHSAAVTRNDGLWSLKCSVQL